MAGLQWRVVGVSPASPQLFVVVLCLVDHTANNETCWLDYNKHTLSLDLAR